MTACTFKFHVLGLWVNHNFFLKFTTRILWKKPLQLLVINRGDLNFCVHSRPNGGGCYRPLCGVQGVRGIEKRGLHACAFKDWGAWTACVERGDCARDQASSVLGFTSGQRYTVHVTIVLGVHSVSGFSSFTLKPWPWIERKLLGKQLQQTRQTAYTLDRLPRLTGQEWRHERPSGGLRLPFRQCPLCTDLAGLGVLGYRQPVLFCKDERPHTCTSRKYSNAVTAQHPLQVRSDFKYVIVCQMYVFYGAVGRKKKVKHTNVTSDEMIQHKAHGISFQENERHDQSRDKNTSLNTWCLTWLGTTIIEQVREHSVLWATVDGELKWQLHIFCLFFAWLLNMDIVCRKLFFKDSLLEQINCTSIM